MAVVVIYRVERTFKSLPVADTFKAVTALCVRRSCLIMAAAANALYGEQATFKGITLEIGDTATHESCE